MSEWMKHLPFLVAGFLRTAIRALIGITLVFASLFLCWFAFEMLVHLKDFCSRTIFGHNW